MKASRGFVAIAIALLAVLCASCSSSGQATPATSTTTSPKTFPAGSTYVALGSSYAAGPGIPVQSGGACARSNQNYPNLVARSLNLTLDDVSCSGATTANVLTSAQGASPPQIDAVNSHALLVTFTVGGNDIGYTVAAFACGAHSGACAVDQTQLSAELATLDTSLTSIVSAIRARAPTARILLVTYPRLVPPTTCPALNFTPQGGQLIGAMGQRLEQVFLDVAHTTNVLLADPYAIGNAHGPCAPTADRWIAGQTVTVGFPYHPTPLGQMEMALLAEQDLRR